MQKMVLPNYFYPYVRKGDVAAALTNSLQAINARKIAFTGATTDSQQAATLSEDTAGSGTARLATASTTTQSANNIVTSPAVVDGPQLWCLLLAGGPVGGSGDQLCLAQ